MSDFSPLTSSDAQEAAEIHRLCLPEHWSSRLFRTLLLDPAHSTLCLRKEFIVGFLVARFQKFDNAVEILTFVVRPESQNQGYGRLILSHFLANALDDSIQKVILEVRESNKNALHLYHLFGFDTVGRRKNYYETKTGEKEDALLLQFDYKKTK